MDDFRISDMKRRRQEGAAAPPHPDSRPVGEGPGEKHGVFQNSASAPAHNQFAETINLRQYWETILRYRLFVVGITLAVFLATLLTNYLKQPRYKTQVEILRKEEIGGRGSAMESKFYLPETLIKIAVSRMVSEKSVAFLADAMQALAENGHEISDKDWEIARNVTPQELPGTLNARLDSDSPDILYIEAVSEKSEIIVAAFANAAARSFILRLSSIDQKEASQKCIILKGLKDAKQKEINDIEAKILSLKRRHEEGEDSFAVIAADERRLLDLVAEYEMLYQENKLKQEELHEQVKSIKHELNIDGTPTDTIQWVDMSNVMEKKLQELKMKRAELLTRYTPDNPLVSRLSSQIKAMESIGLSPGNRSDDKTKITVDMLQSKLVTRLIFLESQLQGVITKLASIRKMRDDLNRKLIELPVKTLEIERLKRQKEILEGLADELRRSYQQEKIASTSNIADIQIIEPATPPSGPFYPDRKKASMMGIFFGLFLGIASAFLLEHLDNTINATREIKRRFNIDPLGLIPSWTEENKFINPTGHTDVNAELYGVLRNNIRFSKADKPEKCLLVASAIQAEGKSLTAVNLACSFAQEGNKTLVAALDLRKSCNYYGLSTTDNTGMRGKGMSDFLAGEAEYSEILHETSFENLYVLPSGRKHKNPAMLLNPQKLKRLFRAMEQEFDVVILDAPAILPVVDTTVISPLVRGVLLVVRANKTSIDATQQAINRLEHVNSNIIGAVLNLSRGMKFDSYYGAGQPYYKTEGKGQMYRT